MTPVQVVGPEGIGFLTGIVAISSGSARTLALKSDGVVWAWGAGILGNGPNGSPTPVQTLSIRL